MIAPLFRRNLRHHTRLLVVLVIALALMQALFIQVAAALETGPGFANLVRMMPPAVQNMFSGQLMFATFGAASAFGFQHPVLMTAALAFVIVACTIPAGERESGSLELLLARPIARWQHLMGALAVALVGVIIVPAVLLGGVAAGLATVTVAGELPWSRYIPAAVGLAVILLTFTGMTLLLSATAARRGPAVGRSVGLILVLYLADLFGERLAWLAWFGYLSPFRYFRPVNWTVQGDVPVLGLLVLAAVGLAAMAGAFAWVSRGDAVGGKW